MKPKVFIGSSSERLDIANAVKTNLESIAEATVWTQGIFELTSSVFDNLISQLNEYDFGIFIFWPEDTIKSREVQYSSARDNVVFEFGLFTGGLGKARTFFMYPSDQSSLRLPSDLNGILAATFDSNKINETLEQACARIKQSIQKEGVRKSRFEKFGIAQIHKPKILCASSAQYAQFEFDEDIRILENAFPGHVTVVKDLSSEQLRTLLKENHFDIVHINARVEHISGELVLSDIDFETFKPITLQPDIVKGETLSRLVESSKTQIVVLPAWGTLSLAAKLSLATNVIAFHDMWDGENDVKTIVKWERYFYTALAEGDPMSVAFKNANEDAEAPMYMMMKKDVVFMK